MACHQIFLSHTHYSDFMLETPKVSLNASFVDLGFITKIMCVCVFVQLLMESERNWQKWKKLLIWKAK